MDLTMERSNNKKKVDEEIIQKYHRDTHSTPLAPGWSDSVYAAPASLYDHRQSVAGSVSESLWNDIKHTHILAPQRHAEHSRKLGFVLSSCIHRRAHVYVSARMVWWCMDAP